MPATGGGGMAGLILVWFRDRLRRVGQDEVRRIAIRHDRLEARLAVYLQQTGGYRDWAALQERERGMYRER